MCPLLLVFCNQNGVCALDARLSDSSVESDVLTANVFMCFSAFQLDHDKIEREFGHPVAQVKAFMHMFKT